MLGRLEMSAEECIETYRNLAPHMYFKERSILKRLGLPMRSRYDARAFETAIKEILKMRGLDENTLLAETHPRCKVYVYSF